MQHRLSRPGTSPVHASLPAEIALRETCGRQGNHRQGGPLKQGFLGGSLLDLLYLSTSLLWWQAVADIIGVTSSTTLRNNSRCTWRPSEGARNVSNTAIRRAFSPLRPCGSVTADVHGYPRGVAPLRHPLASRDTPVAHTGEETTPSPHHATGGAAHPSLFFSPPGHGFSTLDTRCKPLI